MKICHDNKGTIHEIARTNIVLTSCGFVDRFAVTLFQVLDLRSEKLTRLC